MTLLSTLQIFYDSFARLFLEGTKFLSLFALLRVLVFVSTCVRNRKRRREPIDTLCLFFLFLQKKNKHENKHNVDIFFLCDCDLLSLPIPERWLSFETELWQGKFLFTSNSNDNKWQCLFLYTETMSNKLRWHFLCLFFVK